MTKLEDVLKDFDRRIREIETAVRGFAGPNVLPKPQPAAAPEVQFEPQKPAEVTPTPAAPTAAPARPMEPLKPFDESSSSSEGFDSSNILGFIGIFFVILAGVYFIKLTIDSGWLTPPRQIMLAASCGLSFFLAPHFFPKADREYGALLAGAGTTILHLTWWGAYSYHHILDATSALTCATVVGLVSILASFGKGNRIYILVALAGTYFSAPIVGYSTKELATLSVFLMIWNISFTATAFLSRRRDVMMIASYYAALTVLLLSNRSNTSDAHLELLTLQLSQFVVFAAGLLSYSIYYKQSMNSEESVALMPLLLLFYFTSSHFISTVNPALAPWLGVIVGSSLLLIYLIAKKYLNDLKTGAILTAFGTLALIESFYFQLLDKMSQTFMGLIVAFGLLTIAKKYPDALRTHFWPALIISSTVIYSALLTIVSPDAFPGMLFFNWMYAVMALVVALGMRHLSFESKAESTHLVLAFAHVEMMLGFYRMFKGLGEAGAIFVTSTWGVYAVAILLLAFFRRDKILGNSALTILLAVSLKAFFYDVANTTSVVRVVCLLIEGLLLYGCGWIFKRMEKWT